jgi:hypothetical protein
MSVWGLLECMGPFRVMGPFKVYGALQSVWGTLERLGSFTCYTESEYEAYISLIR